MLQPVAGAWPGHVAGAFLKLIFILHALAIFSGLRAK